MNSCLCKNVDEVIFELSYIHHWLSHVLQKLNKRKWTYVELINHGKWVKIQGKWYENKYTDILIFKYII